MNEIWKRVSYDSGYEVSNLGNVRSYYRSGHTRAFETPRAITPVIGSHGYPVVNLRGKVFCVHHLVCTAFYGDAPAGHEVGHGDGSRTNNEANNLRWVTRAENVQDAISHGRWDGRTELMTAVRLGKVS